MDYTQLHYKQASEFMLHEICSWYKARRTRIIAAEIKDPYHGTEQFVELIFLEVQ